MVFALIAVGQPDEYQHQDQDLHKTERRQERQLTYASLRAWGAPRHGRKESPYLVKWIGESFPEVATLPVHSRVSEVSVESTP